MIPLRLGRLCNWIQFLLCDATIATLRPDNWQCEVHGHRKHASLLHRPCQQSAPITSHRPPPSRERFGQECNASRQINNVVVAVEQFAFIVPRGKTALRAQGRWGLPAGETTHPPPGHTCPTLAKPPTHPDRKINLWGGKSPAAAKKQNPGCRASRRPKIDALMPAGWR